MNMGERAVDAMRIPHRPSLGTMALDGKVGSLQLSLTPCAVVAKLLSSLLCEGRHQC
jgi:hypothetical protein